MNSNHGKGSSSGSLNNFQFDFGIGSNQSKPLNGQKNPSYSASQPKPAWQPNKPSWTHQPAPSQTNRSELASGHASMVGDIFGKTWGSSVPPGSAATAAAASVGIVNKNPNLFGDLVSSAIGQGKTGGNVPLKSTTPDRSPYSMGNLADTLPKTTNSSKSGGNWGGSSVDNANFNGSNNNKIPNLGGPSMKNLGRGIGATSNKDPFGSLFDLGSKQSSSLNTGSKSTDGFGDFQTATKSSTSAATGFSSNANAYTNTNTFAASVPNMDEFKPQNQSFGQSPGGDTFGAFYTAAAPAAASPEVDDWGFGGNEAGGVTTELDGLPPPPAGVTASSAKNKGVDNKNQGQYADAIKWLSWAVILMEKTSDRSGTVEVLSGRASCYKEVGEYKKAVADCSKALEHDEENVSILVQRALLYESMEKYKLGAEDLRTVLKIDPGNRVARSTVHRLSKMAE